MSESMPPNSGSDAADFGPDAIDRYLDGQMPALESERFEAEIARSPALRAQIELQERLDHELRKGFAVPAPPLAGILTREEARTFAESRKATGWSREFKMLGALAALLALTIGIQGYLWLSAQSSGPAERTTLAAAYFKLVDHGFRPSEECTTAEKFAKWTALRFGAAIAPKENRPDVQLIGWTASDAISNYTGMLLAKVDGKPVVVAFDTVDNQNDWGAPCRRHPEDRPGLNFFSGEIGGIAVYEITPLDKPRILDNLAVLGQAAPRPPK